eukprot:4638979-Prymnesium_polylepis.2
MNELATRPTKCSHSSGDRKPCTSRARGGRPGDASTPASTNLCERSSTHTAASADDCGKSESTKLGKLRWRMSEVKRI